MQCSEVCHSILQCVTVCCSVLQCRWAEATFAPTRLPSFFTEIQDSFNTRSGSFAEAQGFSIECGALWRNYTALLTEYRAFSQKSRALWTECRALFKKNRAHVIENIERLEYRALVKCTEYRAPRI